MTLFADQLSFLTQRAPNLLNPNNYNLISIYRITEAVKVNELSVAIFALIEENPILMSRFSKVNGLWSDFVDGDQPDTILTVISCSSLQSEQMSSGVGNVVRGLNDSLNISCGPVVRFAILTTDARHATFLVVVAHHLVVDQISMRNIGRLLEERLRPREDYVLPAPPQAVLCADLISEFSHRLKDRELAYWISRPWDECRQLAVLDGSTGLSVLRAPVGKSLEIPEKILNDLRHVASKYRCNIGDILFAAVADALTSSAGGMVAIHVTMNGRTMVERVNDRLSLVLPPSAGRSIGPFAAAGTVFVGLRKALDASAYLEHTISSKKAASNSGVGLALLQTIPGLALPTEMKNRVQFVFNFIASPRETTENAIGVLRPFMATYSRWNDPLAPMGFGARVNVTETSAVVRWTYDEYSHADLVSQWVEAASRFLRELVSTP